MMGHHSGEAFLNNLPAEHETQYLRHVHFDQPLVVKMDGKKNKGAVMLPGKE